MAVPLLDLRAQHATIAEEIEAAVARVLESQRFILGEEVASFEQEIAALLEIEHAIGVSSGSDALYLALRALGVGPGSEVITTVYSFFATAGSIVRCGATPVFVDIDEATYNFDVAAALERITPRTAALMPVHLFGRCAEVEALRATKLPIVEDAAQAIGARRGDVSAGALGDIGCFSFFPSKNLGAAGDGGLLSCADDDLAGRLRSLRVHGQRPDVRYEHLEVGGNYRLDALQAAILAVKLPHLQRWNQARRDNAARYRALFDQADVAPESLTLPPRSDAHSQDVVNQFVIRVAERDALKAYLAERGVGSAIYYPRPLHLQPCFAALGGQRGDFPRAEAASAESLALPVYPELQSTQLEQVVDHVVGFLRSRGSENPR
jgi:dTDP-4-amino-4,6-dideoxygalactose transaminase